MPFKPYSGETVDDKGFKPYQGETVDDPNYTPPAEPSMMERGKDILVESAAQALNPIGGLINMANRVPGVQDYIPDFMGAGMAEQGMAKGGYNAARNVAQLGADVVDYALPNIEGAPTHDNPMSDMLSAVPEAKYDGTGEAVVGNITEIASGFLLGNKLGALARTEKLGADAVNVATKMAPEAAHKLITFAAKFIGKSSQGIIGTAMTTKPGSTNIATGKGALITKLGIGPLLDGLPTDSKDSAQNALAARVNTVLDGFITGAGLQGAFEGIGALNKILVGPQVYDKLSPLWSNYARLKAVFNQVGEDFKKIPGVDSKEKLQQMHDRAAELASNKEAGTLTKDIGKELGMAGVEPIHEALDTATTIGRQAKASGNAEDIDIANALEGRAKEIGLKGYEKTATRREAPTRALERTLNQTEEVLGGPKTAEAGMKDIQDIGASQVQQGKSEQGLAQTEITNTTENITQHVSHEREITGKQVDELFDAIPADAKYDPKSLTKIIAEEKDTISPEVKDMLTAKENDGSFKYLNRKVKTRVNSMITKLEKLEVRTHDQQLELAALKRVKKNIAEDQIKHLEDTGRPDVVKAAKTAQEAWEARVAGQRQGVVGDLQKIEDTNPFKLDNIKAKSHDALVKEIGNLEHPSHEKRLRELLSTDEGGRSEALIEQYKNAKDKVAELDNIEKKVYGDKLREFYDQHNFTPVDPDDAVGSFEKFLSDPQKNARLKEILSDAETVGKPGINQALKYAYARSLKNRLFSGAQTELGSPTTNAPGVQGLLNNESFMKAGDTIYKDSPEFMVAVRDTLEIAHDIQKAAYKRSPGVGTAGMIVERAKQGLKTAVAPFFGPLSHKGYVIKNIFSGLLEVLGPQGTVNRMADALLENGTVYAEAWETLKNTKDKTGKNLATVIKVVTNSVLRTNGEREKFDRAVAKLRAEDQTEDALKKKSAGPEGEFKGQLAKGNIDLTKRPKVDMGDGTFGTVYSESRGENGREVLYPRIVKGKLLSSDDAWSYYRQTGENLGKFDTPEHADAYAEALHKAQEEYYK